MEEFLLKAISNEAQKHIERYQIYHNSVEIEFQRNKKRIKMPSEKNVLIPLQWNEDKKFNPFYVMKNKEKIARSIYKKLVDGSYTPFKPHIRYIPKKGGDLRKVVIFQIPDAAVSNYIYYRLLSKNKHRFSSLAYAYRNDRNAHYAIQDIALELKSFIAEFDFKKFFDSIEHDFLYRQLNQNGFTLSEFEKKIIKSFIEINERGIPQGTSISLFLANLVCWKLDRRLENEGLRFARYADDTVVLSTDYSKICKAVDIIYDFAKEAGIDINLEKSPGINLLSKKEMKAEMANNKTYLEFLGYKLSSDKTSIKDGSVKKIKKQISYLLYRNLLQPINSKPFKAVTIPNRDNFDPAFITTIMQIRRYLYGNLNDEKINRYLNGAYKKLSFKGIMSYYPLIDDDEQLKELDSWLMFTILNCLKARKEKLIEEGYRTDFFPFNITKDNLIRVCRNKSIHGKRGLIQIPSFLRIYKAIKKGILEDGLEKTMNPCSNQYNYY